MKRAILAAGVAVLTALAAAGCGPQHHAASASASALATSTAVRQAETDLKRCVPSSAVAQISLAHQILGDTKAHPNGAWAKLLGCLGITRANEKPAEQKALAAAEAAKPSLLTKTGRDKYLTSTLPAIAQQYAGTATAPSPGAAG